MWHIWHRIHIFNTPAQHYFVHITLKGLPENVASDTSVFKRIK